jgi:glutamyl-tRNA synthetase
MGHIMGIFEIALKHALKNASEYGKADTGAVVGKVISEFPDAKKDMKGAMAEIAKAVAKANSLGKEEVEKQLSGYTFEEKKKTPEAGLTIPNAVFGKVVTRFPPEPSGCLHIGHAKAAWLDSEAAHMNGGKMILRFDDTNPEKESLAYVDTIKKDLLWLGIKWEHESYTSDSLEKIYSHGKAMLENGKAYVCTCAQERISENRKTGKECECRHAKKAEQMEKWAKMHDKNGFPQGGAIVRYAGDMTADNTVMRDPSLFRIILAKHYRQGTKYRVWPTYDFAAPIIDSLEGVTHAMRSKEYELRDELYFALIRDLGLKRPELVEFSRLGIKNTVLSKRFILPLVESGKLWGWDDPRLPTIAGLRRRGMRASAILEFVKAFGLSKVESEPGIEKLLAFNRRALEKESGHYFFVPNPVKITIANLDKEIVLSTLEGKGDRKMHADGHVYIPSADFEAISEGDSFRLKDLCNAKLVSKATLECELAREDVMPARKVQWVGEGGVQVLVHSPKDLLDEKGELSEKSMEEVRGVAERGVHLLKAGDSVQFERFGFCRLDKTGNVPEFILTC